MKIHQFNTEIAKDLGIGAVFVDYIAQCVLTNEANNKHFHEGTYWTYNTAEALLSLFEYFTKNQLRTVIKNAIDKGYLRKGNFNKDRFDRTLWYALSEKSIKFYKN